MRLITDPVFRARFFHVRRVAPGPDDETLRGLDAALVSHLHYDHLDRASLRRVGRSLRVVAPTGARRLLGRWGVSDVVEVAAGDEVSVGAIAVRATEAEHDGKRHPLGTAAATVGYVVAGSHTVYFAGDTDLFDGMHELAPELDVALLPVGGWGPRIPAGHLDPRRAAEALVRLRPRVVVPIHWGTYRRIGLRRDRAALQEPADAFVRYARDLAPDVEVRVLPVGGTVALASPTSPVLS